MNEPIPRLWLYSYCRSVLFLRQPNPNVSNTLTLRPFVRFESPECQKEGWKTHKKMCKVLKDARWADSPELLSRFKGWVFLSVDISKLGTWVFNRMYSFMQLMWWCLLCHSWVASSLVILFSCYRCRSILFFLPSFQMHIFPSRHKFRVSEKWWQRQDKEQGNGLSLGSEYLLRDLALVVPLMKDLLFWWPHRVLFGSACRHHPTSSISQTYLNFLYCMNNALWYPRRW